MLHRITKGQALLAVGILFSLVFLIYGRSIDYPFVRFDDGLLIYDNPVIRAMNFTTLGTIFSTYDPELYIPLTLLSYQFDFLIGGINPAIYHLQNILWHAMNALLVTLLLFWLLFLRDQSQIANPTSAPASAETSHKLQIVALTLGALFAIHPINVEAVAWASARKDLLSTFFALGSMLAYLQWSAGGRKRWFYGSLVLFAIGLLCKVTILTLPLILLILDLWCRRRVDRNVFLEKIPFFALSLAFAVIAIFGKAGQLASVTPMETILVASKAIVSTMQHWFIPLGLSVLYPYNNSVTIGSLSFLLPFLGLLGFLGFAFFFVKKRAETQQRCVSTIILCAAFFLFALVPSLLNFAKGGTIYMTSDRYGYFAGVGLLLGLGTGVIHFLRGDALPVRLYRKRMVSGMIFLILGIGIALSIRQTKTWARNEALFTNVLKHYPDAHVAHNNLANYLTERPHGEGKISEAIMEYEKALQIAKDLPHRGGSTDPMTSKILSNLASALRQSGDITSAKKHYAEALKRNPINPYAFLGLGIVAALEGRMGEAEGQYLIALQIAPKFSPALLNLGALYSATGRYAEALDTFDQGIAIDPFAPQAHYNRAVVLQKMHRMTEARVAYEKAIDIVPSFVAARINLGILEANRGRSAQAIEQFQEVLRYDPGNSKATEALRQLR
ncbi:hypothetical protein A3C37_01250 [Candidatus Peribacteria bacterium RIFCSPHIGHO2_02_FULL_53_20]|nr:MAG: hypothetical protein A3C37_01250 [Candidatus Peribacteria bacterium RIFCSPHIGHO2_02_FULL_53_20]OGJ68292.1 MAG: hypothetical protein A3B61_01670 [Candidatus Peribacteria bacterium RIFCSPLOWO2_01_FULL_53_10]